MKWENAKLIVDTDLLWLLEYLREHTQIHDALTYQFSSFFFVMFD